MSFWIKAPKGGTCCACKPIVCSPCTCPAPTLVCDSISASKTKCGFDEFGTSSSPPKKYLTKTASGTGSESVSTNTNVYSGADTYDRTTCVLTEAAQLAISDSSGSLGTMEGGPDTYDATCNLYYGNSLFPQPGGGVCNSPNAALSQTITTMSWNWSSAGGTWSGAPTATLSSEYTTAQLISDAGVALPSYPGTYAGTCSSYRNLSTDELTYTVRRFKYKFTLPSMTGITSYVINWKEGATSKSYSWDGVSTETPVYGEVYEPSTNGTIGITDITVTCT